MKSLWLVMLVSALARAESPPELVRIFSINGRQLGDHPAQIDVLPGQEIAFRADVLQFGDACPHPEGCPEGRNNEEFTFSADDRENDSCSAAAPEACRDRTSFEPQGNEMIYHIPYAMGRQVRIAVSHARVASGDTIVLHNAHFGETASREETPPSRVTYPTLAPTGIDEPYCGPYYPYAPCWHTYYAYSGYSEVVWWEHPRWTFGITIGYAPWPYYWGWPPWGWHPYYYRPGYYAFYHHHPIWHRAEVARPAVVVAPRPGFVSPAAPRFHPHRFRRRWR